MAIKMPSYSNSLISIFILITIILTCNVLAFSTHQTCPDKEVYRIREEAQLHEISLIFYYVSWSKQNLYAKSIYELAILPYISNNNYLTQSIYVGSTYFATIDCWHLLCNCSKLNNSVSPRHKKWPVLKVRIGSHIKLQYLGDWNFKSFTTYLHGLFKPLHVLYTKNELKLLSMQSSYVILGLFNNAEQREYKKFTAAAIKSLENDPEQNYPFAIAFNKSAEILNDNEIHEKPYILLITSKTVEYFNDTAIGNNWNSEHLLAWINYELKKQPNTFNSYNTAGGITFHLKHNKPVLAIFYNQLNFKKHFFTIMDREGATIDSIQKEYDYCRDYWKSTIDADRDDEAVELFDRLSMNDKSNANVCQLTKYLNKDSLSYYYTFNYLLTRKFHLYQGSTIYDEYFAENIWAAYEHYKCIHHPDHIQPKHTIAITKFLKRYSDKLWLETFKTIKQTTAETSNHTLSILLLNAEYYLDFLQDNGIQIDDNKTENAATAIIIDSKKESVYKMQEKFTFKALLQFIVNFHKNNLTKITKISNNDEELFETPDTAFIKTVNRQTLFEHLRLPNKTSLVLFYTPECYFSVIMSQTLLQLSANLLKSSDIQFLRINVRDNDMPWEFNVAKTPTLLLFPQNHLNDSIVFPSHLKANARNIYSFILANLENIEQMKIIVRDCQQYAEMARANICFEYAQTTLIDYIEKDIKNWNLFQDQRSMLSERLQQFYNLAKIIQSSFRYK